MTDTGHDIAVFTVCNVSYLPKALLLADSMHEHGWPRLKIVIADRKVSLSVGDSADILWIEDMEVPNLERLAFKYDVTEFSTCVKPHLSLRFFNEARKVIYLDPDILVYSAPAPIVKDLDQASIVLTPHYTTPQDARLRDADLGMMRFGSFNLGFYAVRDTAEARSFLEWLSGRCFNLGFFETQFGLSTDQKWVSIVPCLFQDLKVSFHLGYNVAFWNVHERQLSRDAGGRYVVNGKFPLVYFHFSAFDEANPENLSKRPFPDKLRKRRDLAELSLAYKALLDAKRPLVPRVPYAFDHMSDGAYISPTLRRAYACVLDELPANHDPFDANGVVGAFARKNHLLERQGSMPYVSSTWSDIGSHKLQFAIVYFWMRLILRVIGPNRFANFARLLVYLSSYRQNRQLWKI